MASPGPPERLGRAESATETAEPSVPAPRVDSEWLAGGDAELAERFKAGDVGALAAVYRETSALVFTIALRALASPSDAEDVAQRVFVQAWRGRATYDPARRPLTAWLVGITRHVVAVRIAGRSQQSGIEQQLGGVDLVGQPSEDGMAERVADAIVVADALSRLDQPRREVVEMSFFDGLTHTQISASLGIPVATVKSHIKRGIAELRRELAVSDGAS